MLSGGKSLLVRQIILSVAGITGSILLARLLSPSDFGLYVIISFLVSLLSLMGDGGLGAGLIQKKEEPSAIQYNTVFWMLQLLFGTVFLLGIPVAHAGQIYYDLSVDSIYMVMVLLFSTYLTAFRVIPTAILGRNLLYDKLAVVETVEGVGYQVLCVTFAVYGFGVWSFVLGLLISRLLGLLLIYRVSTFYPRFEFSFSAVKGLMKFGIARQGTSIVGFLRQAVVPAMIGSTIGLEAVGYINWAEKVAGYLLVPVTFFGRMIFPALSRLQHDDKAFNSLLHTIILLYVTLIFVGLVPLSVFLPETIAIVFSPQWLPAAPVTYWIFSAYLLVPFAYPIFDALTAKGKSNLIFLFAVIQLVMTWTIGLVLIQYFGIDGYGITYALLQVAGILVFYLGRKLFKVNFLTFGWHFVALVISMLVGILLKFLMPIYYLFQLGGYYIFLMGFYLLILYVLSSDARSIIKKVKKAVCPV